MSQPKINIKEINQLAIPAIIAGVSEPLISLVDTAIIGKLGTVPLAAVGIASSFYLIIIWTLAQTKSSISSLVSHSVGKRNLRSIYTFIPQSLLINVIFGSLIFMVTAIYAREIFEFYNATGNLLELTIDYYLIRGIGLPITLATYALFGVFRGIQNTKWAMQISLIGGGLNLILDLILVFGIDGVIPAMGIKGAALASLISQIFMLFAAVYNFRKKSNLKFYLSVKTHPKISTFLSMTGNLFIRTIALNVVYFIGVKYATALGEEYSATHTIAINIWLFSSFLIDGYANAGNAMSGKFIGAGDIPSLKILTKKLIKANLYISLFLALIYSLSYPIIGSLFSNDQNVLALFQSIFWMVIVCQPINAIAFTYDGIFKGLGKMKILRNALLMATFFGFVPFLFFLSYFEESLTNIWIAFIIWMFLRASQLHFNFKCIYGKQIHS